MATLILLATATLAFFGTWAFLKIVWEPGNTEHLKAQAYIRDLQWKNEQLDAGINPDGMPFDYDHSSDYHNYNCTCEQCKRIAPENQARIQRDKAKLIKLRSN